ncbi:hypothetical protein RJ639_016063 [Escallonia herrerae]|uniref:Transposase (putative) gypsy type domain-containing protein n=1 Tax=Escallonia herrerae TaxID=1293975 RepID=A0AA89AIY6_9ASTE|nr:hypothetical protein RJ639_016063 [Escallonia herrerae]
MAAGPRKARARHFLGPGLPHNRALTRLHQLGRGSSRAAYGRWRGRGRDRVPPNMVREVQNGVTPFKGQRRHVVGGGRHFRGGVRPEPYSSGLTRLTDFGHPLAAPAPYAAERGVLPSGRPVRDALGEIKDEAEDKFDEDTWFSVDEKRNKMTKESIVELLEEIPLPPPFSARVPALQEPANYATNLETSVYEGQIRSSYRVPMHPFAVAFFNHYKMVPGQLVPNGWRKLVGLIYLAQTSGYPVTVDDFMRLYLEVCFIKNMANSVGWYSIHNRIRVINGGPKSNKGWHSRYFFIQRPSGKWEFLRKWNGFCKDYEKERFPDSQRFHKKAD